MSRRSSDGREHRIANWLAKRGEMSEPGDVSDPANKNPEVQRDEQGRILPGSSGNPSGRPKLVREYQQWIRENAWEPAKKALLECLADPDGKIRMMAIKEVNDRMLGKAPQAITTEDGQPLALGLIMLPPEKESA